MVTTLQAAAAVTLPTGPWFNEYLPLLDLNQPLASAEALENAAERLRQDIAPELYVMPAAEKWTWQKRADCLETIANTLRQIK